MHRRTTTRFAAFGAATMFALMTAGCATAGNSTVAETVYADDAGECSAEPLAGVDLAAAQAIVKPFQTRPERLALDEPLDEAPSSDTSVVILDNAQPVGLLLSGFIKDAADAAGVSYKQVSAGGADAQSINTALNSVAEMDPDIVIAPAMDPSFYIDQLASLEDSGTIFVTPAIVNAEDFGLTDSYIGRGSSEPYGDLMAATAITQTCGTATDFVYYNVPELPPAYIQLEIARDRFAALCPQCELRVVDLPIASIDTAAGDQIISDLQAHPETKYFMLSMDQGQIGLSAKQELAGIDVPGIGISSLPANIEQVAQGQQSAAVAFDYEYMSWLFLDEGLRRAQGMDVSYDDWATTDALISTLVTSANAEDIVSSPQIYPDFKTDLVALWGK